MSPALNGRHHAAIKGLPEIPCYVWVEGKAPKYAGWNNPAKLLTPEDLFAKTPPSSIQPNGFGMVSGRWSGTMAVDFDTNPLHPEQSEASFRDATGFSSDALPPSATVVSGRPGRRRVILRVPEAWNVALSGYSANLPDLEFRWEAEGPAPIQSVICGDHPLNKEWHFRWQQGLSPTEVGIAEAPVWLLASLVRLRGEKEGRLMAAADNDGKDPVGREVGSPGPCDELEPKLQRKLLCTVLSPKWPYRGGKEGTRFAASWKSDGYNSLLGALNNVLGPKMAEEWLKDTAWYAKHKDFGTSNSLAEAISSVGDSNTDRPAGWGTLVSLATRNGARTENGNWVQFDDEAAKLPGWALPPKEVDAKTLSTNSAKEVKQLIDGMEEIDRMDEPAQRLAATQMLARSLGKSGAEMAQLLQAIEEGQDAGRRVSLKELLGQERTIRPAVSGLLSRGCLTLVASEGGLAKTTLSYQLGMSILTGGLFAGKMQAIQGPVMFVQKDETDANAQQKFSLMDAARYIPEELQEQCGFYFDCWHPGMFPELRQWIVNEGAVAVFMDSLGTLFSGGGKSINDAEVAMHLYRLNRMAAELDVAIVLTHHIRKRQPQEGKTKEGGEAPKRQKVKSSDLYGSAYIVNSASDVWGLTRDGGTDDEPVFALDVLKARSNVSQKGDVLHLQGNVDDLSFQFETFNFSNQADHLNGSALERVLAALHRSPEAALSLEELVGKTQLSMSSVKRVIRELYQGRATTGVDRSERREAGKKATYVYYRGRS